MLDNAVDLVPAVGLLSAVFDFPTTFVLGYMVSCTAMGATRGDLTLARAMLRLVHWTGHGHVTAIPKRA